ncbi:MAG: DUF4214 domain-containing protein [Acidimicrobiales bacterium]
MRRTIAVAAGVALVAGLGVVAPSSGAGAAGSYTTEVSGSAFRVTTSGGADVVFGCSADQITIGGVVPSPTMACSLVAEAVVFGDDGGQTIDARAFDDVATFAQEPRLATTTAGGEDIVYGTHSPDIVQTGAADDQYWMAGDDTAADTIDLGSGGYDALVATGTSGDDTIAVSSAFGTTTVTIAFDPGVTSTADGVEVFSVDGGPGDDTLTSAGIVNSEFVVSTTLVGGPGDDQITGGAGPTYLYGGPGTNDLTTLHRATIDTSSDTDHIALGDSDSSMNDDGSAHYGGRTITGGSGLARHFAIFRDCDVVLRSRPDGGSVRQTASLCRPGQQVLPPVVDRDYPVFAGTLPDRSLFDVVLAPGIADYGVNGETNDLLDVTVPVGTFHIEDLGFGNKRVVTDSPSYNNVDASQIDAISVHGPWTDKAEGFAHRATRDLLFRFPTEASRKQTAAKLTAGTLTRSTFVASLMGTDEYRGLDVDRVFVQYLRRKADSGGRSYWIGSIRKGKALWRFRAQLLGGNEYFAKAGGTNAKYVAASYADALGRAPDPGGLAYWTGKLDKGADRGSVALQFLNSPEARRRRVDDQFLRFLDRYPVASEQATWVAALPSATGEQDLIAYLAGTASYANRS